ncbi:MAG: hypothetical protein IT423_23835 [Pirellulaceae bacterium]|nr:hypothetical protein [Pirellulaceae bacterium]
MVRTLFSFVCWLACTCTLQAAAPKPAYEILPQTTQAVVLLPDSEVLAERWGRTQLSLLADDPQVREFWNDQQQQIEEKLTSAGWRLNIQPRDLSDVVQGQIALAWIERREDVRKPFALGLVVDVINREAQTRQFLMKLDNQLKERGSKRTQLKHADVDIAQHRLPHLKGELLPQDTFYAVVNEQMLASDDLGTLQAMIEAALGKATGDKLDKDPTFLAAREQLQISKEGQVEYFARPLGFARVLRAISGKRPGGSADVLAVLQSQGFESIKAVCGEINLGQERFDVKHRGFVLADGSLKQRPAAVQILDFPNDVRREVPNWVSDRVSSLFATSWNVKEAFWKAEGLVDAMAGEPKVFQEIIEGIRVDPTGPQIDIRKDVIPLLTNEIYSVSDAKMPIDINSRRNLIALRVVDSGRMSKILDQAMKTEPDAKEMMLGGQKIWKVKHEEDSELDLSFDAEFQNFAKQGGAPPPQNDRLLSSWAITVYDGYLMFASHEEMIGEAIAQAKLTGASPLTQQADYQRITEALAGEVANAPMCAWRINRSALAYRAQYELFKSGKLQDSESMFAMLLEHLVQNKSEIPQKKTLVDGAKLPAFEMISKYLEPSGTYIRTVDNGWSFGSVLLAKDNGQPAKAKPQDAAEANAAVKPLQNAAKTR